jgi:uncharacterized membrane protein
MTGSVAEVWVAGLVLLLTHFGISSTTLRDRMVRRLGEGPFRGLYSLIAAAALVWLVLAWRAAPPGAILWSLGTVGQGAAVILVPIALFLLVGGLTVPNPTAVGAERHLEDPRPVTGVLRITRNPVMWGIGLWAIGHLAANGDVASIGLFGCLAVLALLGSTLIDAKNRRRRPVLFAPFDLATSNLPFAAVIQGRQSLAGLPQEYGLWRFAVVVALYAVLLHGHEWLFGVSPFPG